VKGLEAQLQQQRAAVAELEAQRRALLAKQEALSAAVGTQSDLLALLSPEPSTSTAAPTAPSAPADAVPGSDAATTAIIDRYREYVAAATIALDDLAQQAAPGTACQALPLFPLTLREILSLWRVTWVSAANARSGHDSISSAGPDASALAVDLSTGRVVQTPPVSALSAWV
jgi:hypothetical protein